MIGILGHLTSKVSKNRRNGSLAGATMREWKAWEVANAVAEYPFDSNTFMAALTGSVCPAITVIFGEFLLAEITYPSIASMTDSTSW